LNAKTGQRVAIKRRERSTAQRSERCDVCQLEPAILIGKIDNRRTLFVGQRCSYRVDVVIARFDLANDADDVWYQRANATRAYQSIEPIDVRERNAQRNAQQRNDASVAQSTIGYATS